MNSFKIIPLRHPINAEITVPGSISYTIRAMALAAMTKGSVTIENALKSDDTKAMATILQTLGIKMEEKETAYIIHGDISDVQEKEYELNVQLSGRTARTIIALLCVVPGTKTVICDEGFSKRPVANLVDGLRQLGADIFYLDKEGFLPVRITSSKLNSGSVQIKGNISSQYISALLMIAPSIGELTIEVIGEQSSKPFIDITIDIMKTFGVQVINENYQRYTIQNKQNYKMDTFFVESDATAASYFWGIAAITKSIIKILHMNPKSKQGDIQFVDILEKMGCKVEKNEKEQLISVRGVDSLRAIDVNMNHIPHVVPTMAVVGAFAKGITHLTGLEHLKVKESDRIESPKTELQKMRIQTESTNDSLTIVGGNPQGASIETYGDHRIAMAFAMAGTNVEGITIQNPEVVNKSFPTFWETVKKICTVIPSEVEESLYK